ncbi:hypothetical protein L195_g055718 [Trifolium pratense]|uniref:Uncharacterized protein n=1 Tax=Trifolium pratense TaxID=57577 RepID=A0A2K3KMT4_TRIPR|nr:hypothetical protein L195_g055718 [Trifolium pratense]
MRNYFGVSGTLAPVDAKGIKGVNPRACVGSFIIDGVDVPIRTQVHISGRLSTLGLTLHSCPL